MEQKQMHGDAQVWGPQTVGAFSPAIVSFAMATLPYFGQWANYA